MTPWLLIVFGTVLCAGLCDWRSGKIPNLLTLGLSCAAALRASLGGHVPLWDALGAAVLLSAAPLVMFYVSGGRKIGGGDVKLFFAVGLSTGLGVALCWSLFALTIAAIRGLIQLSRLDGRPKGLRLGVDFAMATLPLWLSIRLVAEAPIQ